MPWRTRSRFSSSFRLIPFPSQYVLVKRVEESNHLRQKNRINVDHLFRPFEMQYQTMRWWHSSPCSLIQRTLWKSSQEMKHLIIPTTRYVREEMTPMASAPLPNPSINNNHSQTPTILLSWLQNTTDLNQQSLTSDSLQHTPSETSYRELRTSDRTAPFDQTVAKTNSSTSSSSSAATVTSHTKKQIALKSAETFEKMKRLLELLRLHLTNKSNMMRTMTLDSLQSTSSVHSTYSVSSTSPISFENRLPDRYKSSSSSQSTINVENEITPIDELVPFRRHRSEIRIRNTAQNINQNQKSIDDDCYEDMEETMRISNTSPVQYMPSSFMFILQLLLLSCLLHRLLNPSDLNVLDLMLNNASSSAITETETQGWSSQTLWKHILLSVFHR